MASRLVNAGSSRMRDSFVHSQISAASTTPAPHGTATAKTAPRRYENMTADHKNLYRILIVDDEAAICELLAEILKSPTRSIEVRDTAQGALEFLARNPVDLAFLDINIPGMTGLELAEHVRRANPQARIIICTGYFGEDIEEQARDVRADRVIHKPLDFGEVLQVAETYTHT
jgi:CheY-like chemotaxis protein